MRIKLSKFDLDKNQPTGKNNKKECRLLKVLRMVSIGAAARQTGITAATLRKWETRYGFPVPVRGTGGQRQFKAQDLDALARIARRIAAGQRASIAIARVQGASHEEVEAPLGQPAAVDTRVGQALGLLQSGDLARFEAYVEGSLMEQGTRAFVSGFAIPLIEAVGTLWQEGKLAVYAEHVFSSSLQSVINRHVPPRAPAARSSDLRVLLASPSQEIHTLALTLFNALLCQARIPTVFLAGGLPATEIAAAARAYRIDVVALSASAVCPAKALKTELLRLRALLPVSVKLWIGGAGAQRVTARLQGIEILTSIDEAVENLKTSTAQKSAARGTVKDRKL
jgi:hypothetical protein